MAIKRLTNILKYAMVVLSIMGLVTFSLFILEESFQTIMFGTWPAQDAKRWDIVHEGVDLMDDVVWTMDAVNYALGWIQPIAFISYRSYAKSARFYTKALRAKAFAYAPEEFVGEKVSFTFRYNEIRNLPDGSLLLINGKIGVRVWEKPQSLKIEASGVLEQQGKLFIIDIRLF